MCRVSTVFFDILKSVLILTAPGARIPTSPPPLDPALVAGVHTGVDDFERGFLKQKNPSGYLPNPRPLRESRRNR